MEKITQIYDKIFKRILTLSSYAVIRFINTVFEKDFDLASEITYNWTESIDDKLGKMISDTIITINGIFKFHIEVQISDDKSMAVRMFEYEFKEAIKYKKTDENRITLNLPEARIIFLEHTENTPDFVELIFNFQGQEVFEYKIRADKLLNYAIEDLTESGMIILMPLYLLKLRKEIKKSYNNKSAELALELKKLVESCIISIEDNEKQGNITHEDTVVLTNLLSLLYNQLYGKYHIFKKEGVDTMLDDRLLTYTEIYGEQRALEKTLEFAKKMLLKGKDLDEIQDFTELSITEILKLKEELEL